MSSQYFRASVGLIVSDHAGRVLAVERYRQPGQWQLPQGGMRVGEEPYDAALRELYEELGLKPKHVAYLGEHSEWLAYELPEDYRSKKTGRGQVQRWLVFRLVGAESKIRLDHGQDHRELRAWSWRDLSELAGEVAAFRVGVYRRLARDVPALLAQNEGEPARDDRTVAPGAGRSAPPAGPIAEGGMT